MAAIVEPAEFTWSALPVCLAPWRQNPYRLVRLWDMLEFSAHRYVNLAKIIAALTEKVTQSEQLQQQHRYAHDGDLQKALAENAAVATGILEYVTDMASVMREDCVALGLSISVAQIDRIIGAKPASKQLRISLAEELIERIEDELKCAVFFKLNDSDSERYRKPFAGWDKVIERFPTVTTDVEEMNKCFALARYAGAVFHSVQTIECGLIEFGKFLNVSDPKSGWSAVTKRLEMLVSKTKYPDLDPLYQTQFNFLGARPRIEVA